MRAGGRRPRRWPTLLGFALDPRPHRATRTGRAGLPAPRHTCSPGCAATPGRRQLSDNFPPFRNRSSCAQSELGRTPHKRQRRRARRTRPSRDRHAALVGRMIDMRDRRPALGAGRGVPAPPSPSRSAATSSYQALRSPRSRDSGFRVAVASCRIAGPSVPPRIEPAARPAKARRREESRRPVLHRRLPARRVRYRDARLAEMARRPGCAAYVR